MLIGGRSKTKWRLAITAWRTLSAGAPLGEPSLAILRAIATHPNAAAWTLRRLSRLWIETLNNRGATVPAAMALARLARTSGDPVNYYYQELLRSRAVFLVDALLSAMCMGEVDTPSEVLHEVMLLHLSSWDGLDAAHDGARQEVIAMRYAERAWQMEHTSHWRAGARMSGLLLRIAEHPNTCENTIEAIWKHTRDHGYFDDRRLRWTILTSSACPVDLLISACWGEDPEHRVLAMQNSRCPSAHRVAASLRA
jgi:hypothetical protein